MNYIQYKNEPRHMIVKLCDGEEGVADIVIGVILANLPLEEIIKALKFVNYGNPIK